MIYKRVILKRGKEESLLRFHPWVFSGAIDKTERLEEGDFVTVYSHDGDLIGNGQYQIGSIAVRMTLKLTKTSLLHGCKTHFSSARTSI